MARTTISIPDDLKKRMDRVKGPINWSAIAAEAFAKKVNAGKPVGSVIVKIRGTVPLLLDRFPPFCRRDQP